MQNWLTEYAKMIGGNENFVYESHIYYLLIPASYIKKIPSFISKLKIIRQFNEN